MMCMILWPWNSPYLNYLCCATDVEAVETFFYFFSYDVRSIRRFKPITISTTSRCAVCYATVVNLLKRQ